jgi:hypothetical protein
MNMLRFEPARARSLVALLAAAAISLCVVFAGPADAASGPATTAAKKKCGKKKGKKTVSAAKKCGKKKGGSDPAPVTVPQTPLPLTAAEVINQVALKANQYCDEDPDCLAAGYYFDTAPGDPECLYRTTYTWACYGYNEEDFESDDEITDWSCDFLEVVSRTGVNGVTSSQDGTFGAGGWDCYPYDP